MKRARPFHPIPFAAYTVLSLYSANTVLIPVAEVWRPLLFVVGGTVAAWAVLGLLLRNAERAASAASVGVLGFFSFGPILDELRHTDFGRDLTREALFPYWVLGWVLLVIAAAWKWRRLPSLTSGLNASALVLALIPTLTIIGAWAKGGQAATAATGKANGTRRNGPHPDIFYIILDGYGRSDALRRDMGLDNSEFIEGLKKRGFYVADQSHANYCQTELSLSSSLNMGFLPDIVPGFREDQQERSVLDNLIDRSRISQTLRGYGYGYIGITSGFPGVHPRSADLVIDEVVANSLFEASLLARTPIQGAEGTVVSAYVVRRENLTEAIRTIGRLGAPASRPRFIFAHILAPHPPFVFGPNGEQIRPKRMYAIVDGSHYMQNGGTPAEYARGYSGQAKTIGRLVLQAVDQVLQRSSTRPIIVIQGDHGPKMRLDQEDLAKTDVNEVFPILNAYLVPDEVRKELRPDITPVNSFRTILRSEFGENLPNLPDRSWYSSWTWPFRFIEVTSQIKPKD